MVGSAGGAFGRSAAAGTAKADGTRALEISARARALLVKWSRSRTLATRVVLRSRIILLLAESGSVRSVATTLGVARGTVLLWRRRFIQHGPDTLLHDASGRGRKPVLEPSVRETLRADRKQNGAPSGRTRARELGVSASTVSRWSRRIGADGTDNGVSARGAPGTAAPVASSAKNVSSD